MEYTEQQLEAAARAAHEANRAYCLAIGDASQPSWEDAPHWQRVSAIKGVLGVEYGNTPRESHESWLAEKEATGWKFGPVKDPDKKEHPCFVPYDQLPTAQQAKDHVFVSVVEAMLAAFLPMQPHDAELAKTMDDFIAGKTEGSTDGAS